LLPVDIAMKDGGWQILEFELRQMSGGEVDPAMVNDIKSRLNRLLGPQWAQPMLPA
jgi:hypothetical protein